MLQEKHGATGGQVGFDEAAQTEEKGMDRTEPTTKAKSKSRRIPGVVAPGGSNSGAHGAEDQAAGVGEENAHQEEPLQRRPRKRNRATGDTPPTLEDAPPTLEDTPQALVDATGQNDVGAEETTFMTNAIKATKKLSDTSFLECMAGLYKRRIERKGRVESILRGRIGELEQELSDAHVTAKRAKKSASLAQLAKQRVEDDAKLAELKATKEIETLKAQLATAASKTTSLETKCAKLTLSLSATADEHAREVERASLKAKAELDATSERYLGIVTGVQKKAIDWLTEHHASVDVRQCPGLREYFRLSSSRLPPGASSTSAGSSAPGVPSTTSAPQP